MAYSKRIFNHSEDDYSSYSGNFSLVSFLSKQVFGITLLFGSTGLSFAQKNFNNKEIFDYTFYSAGRYRISQAHFFEVKADVKWSQNSEHPKNTTRTMNLLVSYSFNFAKKDYTHKDYYFLENNHHQT